MYPNGTYAKAINIAARQAAERAFEQFKVSDYSGEFDTTVDLPTRELLAELYDIDVRLVTREVNSISEHMFDNLTADYLNNLSVMGYYHE